MTVAATAFLNNNRGIIQVDRDRITHGGGRVSTG
jgi:hypothetical protein